MSEQPPFAENHENHLKEKIDWLITTKCVDISDGFPARDKDELWAIIWHFFDKENLTRFPIIGIQDPANPESEKIKTFIMFEPGGTVQHLTLWEMITQLYPGQELVCAYTTAIDGFSTHPAPLNLILKDVPVLNSHKRATFYLSLQRSSVFVEANRAFNEHSHPVNQDFTAAGKQALKDIFKRIDVETNY